MFSTRCCDIAFFGKVILLCGIFRAGSLCALVNRIVVSSVSFGFVCKIGALFVYFVRFFV